jgi:hypothetical protein
MYDDTGSRFPSLARNILRYRLRQHSSVAHPHAGSLSRRWPIDPDDGGRNAGSDVDEFAAGVRRWSERFAHVVAS